MGDNLQPSEGNGSISNSSAASCTAVFEVFIRRPRRTNLAPTSNIAVFRLLLQQNPMPPWQSAAAARSCHMQQTIWDSLQAHADHKFDETEPESLM